MKSLKTVIKTWVIPNKTQTTLKLGQLVSDLQKLYQSSLTDLNNQELAGQIKELEAERLKILIDEDDLWRQKIQVIWLKSGIGIPKFSITLLVIEKIENRFRNYKVRQARKYQVKGI